MFVTRKDFDKIVEVVNTLNTDVEELQKQVKLLNNVVEPVGTADTTSFFCFDRSESIQRVNERVTKLMKFLNVGEFYNPQNIEIKAIKKQKGGK
jgi:hypothetical protein